MQQIESSEMYCKDIKEMIKKLKNDQTSHICDFPCSEHTD